MKIVTLQKIIHRNVKLFKPEAFFARVIERTQKLKVNEV